MTGLLTFHAPIAVGFPEAGGKGVLALVPTVDHAALTLAVVALQGGRQINTNKLKKRYCQGGRF